MNLSIIVNLNTNLKLCIKISLPLGTPLFICFSFTIVLIFFEPTLRFILDKVLIHTVSLVFTVWVLTRAVTSFTVIVISMDRVLHRWLNKVLQKYTHLFLNAWYNFLFTSRQFHWKSASVCPATEQANGKFSTLSGCQPDGKMTWEVINRGLAGFPNDNTLKINFSFLEGKQTVSLVDLLTTICGIANMY